MLRTLLATVICSVLERQRSSSCDDLSNIKETRPLCGMPLQPRGVEIEGCSFVMEAGLLYAEDGPPRLVGSIGSGLIAMQ